MTDARVKALESVVDELSDLTDVSEELLSYLSMCDKRKSAIMSNESSAEKVYNLLEITSRRPNVAFDELLDALKATGQHRAVEILHTAYGVETVFL
jgi:hypothetical protein